MVRHIWVVIITLALSACMLLPPQAVPILKIHSWSYTQDGVLNLDVRPDRSTLATGWIDYEADVRATVEDKTITISAVMRPTSRAQPQIIGSTVYVEKLPPGTYEVIDGLTHRHLATIDTSKGNELLAS